MSTRIQKTIIENRPERTADEIDGVNAGQNRVLDAFPPSQVVTAYASIEARAIRVAVILADDTTITFHYPFLQWTIDRAVNESIRRTRAILDVTP